MTEQDYSNSVRVKLSACANLADVTLRSVKNKVDKVRPPDIARFMASTLALAVVWGCANSPNDATVELPANTPSTDDVTDDVADESKTTDNTPAPEFLPNNADGFPELSSDNQSVDATINNRFSNLVNTWRCPAEGESQFGIDRYALNEEFLSVQYSAMQLCQGMPSPQSVTNAVTFSISSGEEVTLTALTQCDTVEQIARRIDLENAKLPSDDCPAPRFSGNFYLENNQVALINFYPSHNDTGCELEIVKPLADLACR